MKTLRVKFLSTCCEQARSDVNGLLRNFNVVEDEENYDYVFLFEYEYLDSKAIAELLSTKES